MKNKNRIMLAAGLLSAGLVVSTSAASCGCANSPASCKCAASCECNDCSCAWGSWGLALPYNSMNAGHLILSKDRNRKPVAKLLWRWASPTTERNVTVDGANFTIQRGYSKPKGKENDKSAWRAMRVTGKVKGSSADCEVFTVDGNGNTVDKPQKFTAKRNPPIGPAPDLAKLKYGTPVNLLAGSIDDFALMDGKDNGWTLKDGILSNRISRDKKGKSLHRNGNLRTKRADFFDFNLKYEVRVLPGCNSGVYLRGIYEALRRAGRHAVRGKRSGATHPSASRFY